jgi:hypothetical protein
LVALTERFRLVQVLNAAISDFVPDDAYGKFSMTVSWLSACQRSQQTVLTEIADIADEAIAHLDPDNIVRHI